MTESQAAIGLICSFMCTTNFLSETNGALKNHCQTWIRNALPQKGTVCRAAMYPRQLETSGTPVWGELLRHIAHGGTAVLQEAEDDLRLKYTQPCHCSCVTQLRLERGRIVQQCFFLLHYSTEEDADPAAFCLLSRSTCKGRARPSLTAHFVAHRQSIFLDTFKEDW